MDIAGLGTPFGLAFASGLNAYLPLLAFASSVRWLHLYKVNPSFSFITSNWFIAVLVLLTLLDFVADKIPLIDHGWDAIHTVIRPIAGALVAAASSNSLAGGLHIPALNGDHGTLVALSVIPVAGIALLVIPLVGGGLAALSHGTKSTTRLVSTITTAGILNLGLSVVEDVLVVIIVLLSLFASTIMLIILLLLVILLIPRIIQARNTWFGRRRRR